MSDNELDELVVSAGAATATDPDGIDLPIAQPSAMNASKFHSVMNVLTDYCQWQECVAVDDLNMLRMDQA